MTKDTKKAPTETADEVTPAGYHALLLQLVKDGEIYGKTMDVAAYKFLNIHLVTQNAAGQDEVKKTVEFKEQLYLIFDTAFWPTEYGRQLVVKDVAAKWACRIIGEEDLNHPDFKGPGLWTNKASGFEFDYIKKTNSADKDIYEPNPEGRRLCLPVSQDEKIPTTWGEPFLIPADGTLAIRERDVPELVARLQRIANGERPEDVLYGVDGKGQKIAALDVYGMMPGFLKDNYGQTAAKPETVTLLETAQQLKASVEPNQKAVVKKPEKDLSYVLDEIVFIQSERDTYRSIKRLPEPLDKDFFRFLVKEGIDPNAITRVREPTSANTAYDMQAAFTSGEFPGCAICDVLVIKALQRKGFQPFVFNNTDRFTFRGDERLTDARKETFYALLEYHGIDRLRYTRPREDETLADIPHCGYAVFVGHDGRIVCDISVMEALQGKPSMPILMKGLQMPRGPNHYAEMKKEAPQPKGPMAHLMRGVRRLLRLAA